MPNPYGNPDFKLKYGEETKVVRLPKSLVDHITALLKNGATSDEVLRQLRSVPLLHLSQLPETPAIYLVYCNEHLLYVGKTENLKQSCSKEFSKIDNVQIAWFDPEHLPVIAYSLSAAIEEMHNSENLAHLVDKDKWRQFEARASENNENASAVLSGFIDGYLAGNQLPQVQEKVGLLPSSKTTKTVNDCIDLKLQDLYERLDTLEMLISQAGKLK